MPDYHQMYLRLAAAQSDAIQSLIDTSNMLIEIHQEVEEMVMNAPEPNIVDIRRKDNGDHEDN